MKIYKCEWPICSQEAIRYNETRVKSDGLHREIISVCDKHYHQMIKENVQNRK